MAILSNHNGIKMFNLKSLINILNNLGIEIEGDDVAKLKLQDDLCIDSQEVVELLADINEMQGIETRQIYIRRSDTLEDIIEKVNCLSNHYDYSRTDTVIIACNVEDIKNAIWNVNKWEDLLSHIEKIDIICNNDIYQKFFMTVKNEKGLLKVQSNRVLVDKKIYFNQSIPPKYLSAHMGCWDFENKGENETIVKLSHQWSISDNAKEYLSDMVIEDIPQVIDDELRKHAEKTLSMWKGIFDATNN